MQYPAIVNARKRLDELEAAIREIDSTLIYLDQLLDAAQPRFAEGKLRITFRGGGTKNDHPVFIKMRKLGQRPIVVKSGQAARSVRTSKGFKPYVRQTRSICKTAETLIRTRRKLNYMVGKFSAAVSGGSSQFYRIKEVMLASLILLQGMGIHPLDKSLYFEELIKRKEKAENDNEANASEQPPRTLEDLNLAHLENRQLILIKKIFDL